MHFLLCAFGILSTRFCSFAVLQFCMVRIHYQHILSCNVLLWTFSYCYFTDFSATVVRINRSSAIMIVIGIIRIECWVYEIVASLYTSFYESFILFPCGMSLIVSEGIDEWKLIPSRSDIAFSRSKDNNSNKACNLKSNWKKKKTKCIKKEIRKCSTYADNINRHRDTRINV